MPLRRVMFTAVLAAVALICLPPPAAAREAREIVRAAWEHWRGVTSQGEMTMTIHRTSWERSMSMKAWTRGQKHSLVRVTAPRKDAGNGTLMIDDAMWTYSPKVNRVMKVPSSMMGQSWMGSDFSNKDVSRADTIVDQYDHTLLEEETSEGQTVHVIQSIPHEDAAVVWGKEVLKVRDDNVLLAQDFYDQDGKLVKSLRSTKVGQMGGRALALVQRMEKVESDGEWTEIVIDDMSFDVDLPDSLFTRSNLRNPRD
jgi:outer membrane lipoprotein-sorting protein